MLTVHHLRQSQSERIVWACEELGLDYELKLYERRADNRLAPDDYKALHPMGIAPVITDGDLVLGESGAILEYIARVHGADRLIPPVGDADYADHLFWFHFANGTFMTNMMMQLVVMLGQAHGPFVDGFVNDRVAKAWALAERRLDEARYFGGRGLTLADIMMGYPLTTARAMRGTSIEQYPNIRAYLARIGERPAYQRAMAKAEPGFTPKLD